jgi:hypothetical protein
MEALNLRRLRLDRQLPAQELETVAPATDRIFTPEQDVKGMPLTRVALRARTGGFRRPVRAFGPGGKRTAVQVDPYRMQPRRKRPAKSW